MKKIIIIGLIILGAGALAAYYYMNKKNTQNRADMAQDIKVFFDYAQEQVPKIAPEIETIKKTMPIDKAKLNELKADLQTFTILNAIAARDVQTLKNTDPEQLQFVDGQIWVDGSKFKETMDGRITSRGLAAENALAFVLFHSILDTTPQEKEQTLAMLNALIEKKLNPRSKAGTVLFVKEKPSDTNALDYPSVYSLSEVASAYSSKEAQKLINDYLQQTDG